jgi:hypothetical protein
MVNLSSAGSGGSRRRFVRSPIVNALALGLLITIIVGSVLVVRLLPQTQQAQQADDGPYLIFHQQTQVPPGNTSPASVAANIDFIDRLPFDGITVDIPASMALMRGEPISYSEMYDDGLAPLTDAFSSSRIQHNFVMAYIDKPGDVFNDQAWSITVENWRNLARAARNAGLQGIFFDNEQYYQQWLNYPEDYDNPTHSLRQYEVKTQQRGREIMEAIVEEYPAIELMVFHGPYASEPKTPVSVRRNQAGLASERELNGPFFIGFLEGLGPQARLIDGGEVYQYRTVDDFEGSYQWRKFELPAEETDSHFIPEALRATWPDRVDIGFGVYARRYADEVMDPCIAQTTLTNALNVTDKYVWFYNEHHTWLAPGGIPPIWEDYIRAAVASVRPSGAVAQFESCPESPLVAALPSEATWTRRGRQEAA